MQGSHSPLIPWKTLGFNYWFYKRLEILENRSMPFNMPICPWGGKTKKNKNLFLNLIFFKKKMNLGFLSTHVSEGRHSGWLFRTSGRPVVQTSGRLSPPLLVKVFWIANISVSIHRIAFIFYIQLPKDIGNTFPGYFCKKNIFLL